MHIIIINVDQWRYDEQKAKSQIWLLLSHICLHRTLTPRQFVSYFYVANPFPEYYVVTCYPITALSLSLYTLVQHACVAAPPIIFCYEHL